MQRWILALGLVLCILLGGANAAELPTEDRAGNPISLPERVETIASLAPSITQVIIDLGLGDKLVAVDTYSKAYDGVPAAAEAFDIMTPDAEMLIALAPDVVLVSGMMLVDGENQLTRLADLGVCVVFIPSSDSIEGILQDTLFIGEIVGNLEGAQALNKGLMDAIETMRVERDGPVFVYFEISPAPFLYSFGEGAFLNEMIELLGGKNIFADQEGWLSVSEEVVIAANPQVIFTNVNWEENAVEAICARPGWETIEAVAQGKVYLIDADASSQPNHRIALALKQMAEAFAYFTASPAI